MSKKYIDDFRKWFVDAYEAKKKVYFQAKAERVADGQTGTTTMTTTTTASQSVVSSDQTPSVCRVIIERF